MTREHISCILELREILLSLQTGFNLVNAAVVCAVLERLSGLEPSSVITEPRYLKLMTVSSFCPFIFYICVDVTGVVCHLLGLLGTDLHAVGCGGFVETLSQFCQIFFSSPAMPSMSSAKRKSVIVLFPMLTVPL